MKFLTTRMRDSYYALPPEKRLEFSGATTSFLKKHQQPGKCHGAYMMAGMRESVHIWDLASEEEAVRITLESPLFQYMDMDVKVMYDLDTVISGVTKFYEGMMARR